MLRAKNLLQIYSARNLWQEGAQREHPKVKLLLTKSHLKASNSCSTVDFRYSKADRAAPKHPNWRRREIVVFSFTKIMPTSAFCSGIENNRWSLSCTCSPFLSVKTWWLVIYTRLLEYKTRLFSKFPGLSCSPASTHPEVALGGGTDSTMHWGAYTLSAFQIIWKSWGGGGSQDYKALPLLNPPTFHCHVHVDKCVNPLLLNEEFWNQPCMQKNMFTDLPIQNRTF